MALNIEYRIASIVLFEALELGSYIPWVQHVRETSELNPETGEIGWNIGAHIPHVY